MVRLFLTYSVPRTIFSAIFGHFRVKPGTERVNSIEKGPSDTLGVEIFVVPYGEGPKRSLLYTWKNIAPSN